MTRQQHTRGKLYNRKQTYKKAKRRFELAKSIGIDYSSKPTHKLSKTGWSCNCWLCKPWKHTGEPTLADKKNRAKFKEEIEEEIVTK